MTTRQGGRRREGRRFFPRRKVCSFCVDKIQAINYKDFQRLRRYISDWGKIESRRKTGTCAPHQRMLAAAIKRSRYVALLPYTGAHSQFDLSYRAGPRADRFRRDRDRSESEGTNRDAVETPSNLPVEEAAPVAEATDSTDEATPVAEATNSTDEAAPVAEATDSTEEANEESSSDIDAEESK